MKILGKIFLMLSLAGALGLSPALARDFGNGLTLNATTPLSDILANPEPYVGQKVQLEGMIVEVCQKRGCWIYLSGNKAFEKIRVKVTDGEIVFPLEARGKQARVEGILQKFVLSREQVIAREQHFAEEQGRPFDPASITSGETVYQLRGVGAVVEGL